MMLSVLFSQPSYEWKSKISYLIYIIGGMFLAGFFLWMKYKEYRAKKYCKNMILILKILKINNLYNIIVRKESLIYNDKFGFILFIKFNI